MRPEQSQRFTERLQQAALLLLEMQIYRKPDDLARRFGLPVPVVRYWWRNSEQEIKEVDQTSATAKQTKQIRKAQQTLEEWEKIKRYRPQCNARLANGKQCKNSVAIRPPEAWRQGCLAERCRIHGGLSKRLIVKKARQEQDET